MTEKVERRDVVKAVAAAGGLLVLGALAPAAEPAAEQVKLEPGKTYLIRVTKQIFLPADMVLVPTGSTSQGFYHNGERQDKPNTDCNGDITQLLDDKGSISYRCERCKKQWEAKGK